VAVRINLLDGPHGEDDIKAIASLPNVDAIVIPKVESAADLLLVEDILQHAAPHRFATTNESGETEQAPRPFKLLATIDSAKGVMNLKDICSATPNLKGRTSISPLFFFVSRVSGVTLLPRRRRCSRGSSRATLNRVAHEMPDI
jgi:citrate lyase beta subunit